MAGSRLLSWRWWLGLREEIILAPPPQVGITAIVPCFNEEESIAKTIRSLQAQTYPIDEIIVIDDCSTDNTAEIARSMGVTVIRTPENKGSKARGQNYVLPEIKTDYFVSVDGDTILDPNALYEALRCLNDPEAEVVCGMVIPQKVETFWEYGRLGEYLFAQALIKSAQEHNGLVFVASGCFTVLRTNGLRERGGFNDRTMGEDMDDTWQVQEQGRRVYFASRAICYPVDPSTWEIYSRQLDRWYRTFLQNLKVRRFRVFPKKKSMAILTYVYLIWFGIGVFMMPLLFVGLLLGLEDAWQAVWWSLAMLLIFVWIPSILEGIRTKVPFRKVLLGLLAFLITPYFNAYIYLRACWKELVVGDTLRIWNKGH